MSERIVILGKGGIGKSTIAANLSELYALGGKRVLHVGCDPKSDSSLLLTGGAGIPTVVEALHSGPPVFEELLFKTGRGIDCLEAGGPAPGEGCAGMGLLKTFELLEANRDKIEAGYDVVLFDVIGDIVCGGFAVPLRKGFGRKVFVVVSDDVMSLYAANNIARAMLSYSYSGARLLGLVANGVGAGGGGMVDRFAKLINVKTLAYCPLAAAVAEAEVSGVNVVRASPRSPFSKAVLELKNALDSDGGDGPLPKPVDGRRLFPMLSGRPGPAWNGGAARNAAAPACPSGEEKLKAPVIKTAPAAGRAPCAVSGGSWRSFFSSDSFSAPCSVRYSGRQVFLAHEDRECAASTARMEEGEKLSFHRQPGVILPGRGFRDESLSSRISSNLGAADVIRGSGNKIEKLAGGVGGPGAPDYIFMHSGCVPYAMGEDIGHLARAAQKSSGVPVVNSTHLNSCSFPGNLRTFFRALAMQRGKTKKRSAPGAVLLLGYGDLWVEELDEMLSAAGVRPYWMLPEYDTESLAAFWAAKSALLSDAFMYDFLEGVFGGHCGKKVLRPASPYGFAATAAWVMAAASLCGREKAAGRAVRDALARSAGAWRGLRLRAASRRAAFVAGARDLERIFIPSKSAGIPLAGFLGEAGFGIDLLMFAPEKKSLGPFKKAIAGGRIPVDFFETEKELRRKLSGGAFSGVWSDFLCDYRVSDAGKAQISMDMFRPGFTGACRTLETILSVCEAGFAGYGRKKS